MKKMISLLAVALLATTFAAGCGPKFKECKDANGKGKAACTKADNFEGKKVCEWTGKTEDDKDGKCAAPVSAYDAAAEAADKAKCNAIAGTKQTDCDAGISAAGKAAGKKCDINAASTNCEFK